MSQISILPSLLSQTLFVVGDFPVSTGLAALAFAGVVVILLVAIIVIVARGGKKRDASAEAQALRASELEQRLSEMLQAQAEASGRAQALGEALAGRQAELARVVNDRLDAVTHRVGQSMEQQTRSTMDQLRHLLERPSPRMLLIGRAVLRHHVLRM